MQGEAHARAGQEWDLAEGGGQAQSPAGDAGTAMAWVLLYSHCPLRTTNVGAPFPLAEPRGGAACGACTGYAARQSWGPSSLYTWDQSPSPSDWLRDKRQNVIRIRRPGTERPFRLPPAVLT